MESPGGPLSSKKYGWIPTIRECLKHSQALRRCHLHCGTISLALMTPILQSFRLDGKVALVTGSASGLGAAIATAFAEAGASVACHGNRRPATDTAQQISATGSKSAAFSADLSTTDGPISLIQQTLAEFGRI